MQVVSFSVLTGSNNLVAINHRGLEVLSSGTLTLYNGILISIGPLAERSRRERDNGTGAIGQCGGGGYIKQKPEKSSVLHSRRHQIGSGDCGTAPRLCAREGQRNAICLAGDLSRLAGYGGGGLPLR
jgi:hypothetical protein